MEEDNSNDVPDSEPNLMDSIEPNLWIGGLSAATDLKVLQQKNINHVLTIDIQPLPINIYAQENLVLKYIKANDTPNEDLLSHFEETFSFIENGLKKGGVLVHCYFGLSRSATIMIAYLMKKWNSTLEYVYEHIKSKRKAIKPNAGFMAQLSLFQNMNCKLDKNNLQYKMFKLCIAAYQVKRLKQVPPALADVIKIDPSFAIAKTDLRVFKCKKCRRVIAQISNIIPHMSGEKYTWNHKSHTHIDDGKICSELYFIEPLTWMENISTFLEGKLYCPNSSCKNKLGSFNWISGLALTMCCQCPCGTRVCPAFYLIPSKVDQGIINNYEHLSIEKRYKSFNGIDSVFAGF